MSKAKQAAAAAAAASSGQASGSSWSFGVGFLVGQLTLALILFFFIRFFLFGDEDPPDLRAAARAAARRQRTLSHSASLRRKRSTNFNRHASTGSKDRNVLTPEEILEKTYYNVDGHQPESLDWFNVLVAQTLAQLRADALNDDAVLTSLTQVLNGPYKPDVLDEIRVTEISLGEAFPIFSNCRVIPVDENGTVVKPTAGRKGGPANNLGESKLQARMDVDLSDVVTLGLETKLVLNYPRPRVAVMPVALSVSVMRFSGTLSVSFTPSTVPSTQQPSSSGMNGTASQSTSEQPSETSHSPTTLTFTFLDDYRLDLSIHSLIGSRSRLQDVPKIAQLIEQRIHAWFDERCVEPRFQQIVLPSLWPRKKNVRGGTEEGDLDHTDGEIGNSVEESSAEQAILDAVEDHATTSIYHGADGSTRRRTAAERQPEGLSADEDSLAQAGAELRAAEERDRERERRSREQSGQRVEGAAGVRPGGANLIGPRANPSTRVHG